MILYEDDYEIHIVKIHLEPMAEKIKHYFNYDFKVYRAYGTHYPDFYPFVIYFNDRDFFIFSNDNYPDLIPVWFNNNDYTKYNLSKYLKSKYLYFRK